jgi:hypothetical protein
LRKYGAAALLVSMLAVLAGVAYGADGAAGSIKLEADALLPLRSRPFAFVSISPTPPLKQHTFWDRTNLGLFGGIAAMRTLDYTSTINMQKRGREEILLPDDVVFNRAGFAALEAAATATSVGLSYLLHATGHHKMERWLSIGHISVTGFGDARNYSLRSKHATP